MKKIRICYFCETWESGGIESFLYNILTRLDLTHVQVDIVTASLGKSVFTEPLRQRGIQFYELSGKQRSILKNYRMFVELMRTKRYDLVHLNIFHGVSLYYAHLAKRSGIPVRIAHSHNTTLRHSAGKPLKLLLHNVAKGAFTNRATELWACSGAAADFLFPRKILKSQGYRFIPNGIEAERFRFDPNVRKQVRADLGLEGKFVIGNVGRLCNQKNQDFLLEVFAHIQCKKLESRLLLVGEGGMLEALTEKARRLGIADSVIFYGVSPHVERLLCAMDVFAFPSRFEGLGIAAVEAQAAGLPVISSECVPNEACVTPLLQRLALNAEPAQWAEALLSKESEHIEREAYASAVQYAGFDIADVAAQIEAYYMRSCSYESA